MQVLKALILGMLVSSLSGWPELVVRCQEFRMCQFLSPSVIILYQ